jgi:hypothetical protein
MHGGNRTRSDERPWHSKEFAWLQTCMTTSRAITKLEHLALKKIWELQQLPVRSKRAMKQKMAQLRKNPYVLTEEDKLYVKRGLKQPCNR